MNKKRQIIKKKYRGILKIKKKKIQKKKYLYKFCFFLIFFLVCLLTINQIFHNKAKTLNNKTKKYFQKNKMNFDGRIFICAVYNNEAEYAYIHLWRLYDYIYKFIIVVSNMTFSGFPKNISFEPFEKNKI